MNRDSGSGLASKQLGGVVDIVLGVSMTPTAVRMVLVEGDKADGVTVDHDTFDIGTAEGTATSAADQVSPPSWAPGRAP